MTPTTEVLKPGEAAAYLGVSTDMLQRWRTSGGGPAFITWGRRTVRYRNALDIYAKSGIHGAIAREALNPKN